MKSSSKSGEPCASDTLHSTSGPRETGQICLSGQPEVLTALAELPALYADCENALSSRTRKPQTRVSGGGGNRSLRLNEEAMEARDAIRTVLRSWVRLIVEEKPAGKPETNPQESCRFLIRNIDWLLHHPAADDFAAEILRLVRTAEHAVQVSAGPSVRLGTCTHAECGAPLTFADQGPRPGSAGSVSIRCLSGHTWPPHEWLSLARRVRASR